MNLSITQTLLAYRKVSAEDSGKLPVRIYGDSKFILHPKAKIFVKNGILRFNHTSRGSEPFVGLLEMLPNATFNVNGNFRFYPGSHVIIGENARLEVGSGYINRNCRIQCQLGISIGFKVAISENVTIWDSDFHKVKREGYTMAKPITIGNHVWIGTNVIILKGVEIGDNSIVAAGSVVTKDIPSNCMAAGNPARVIKRGTDWE